MIYLFIIWGLVLLVTLLRVLAVIEDEED